LSTVCATLRICADVDVIGAEHLEVGRPLPEQRPVRCGTGQLQQVTEQFLSSPALVQPAGWGRRPLFPWKLPWNGLTRSPPVSDSPARSSRFRWAHSGSTEVRPVWWTSAVGSLGGLLGGCG